MRNFAESFKNGVNALFAQTGWSKAELARRLEMAPPAVGRYLDGVNVPGLEMLQKFADVFGVSAGTLLGEAEPKLPADPRIGSLAAQLAALPHTQREAIENLLSAIAPISRLPSEEERETLPPVLRRAVAALRRFPPEELENVVAGLEFAAESRDPDTGSAPGQQSS